MRLQEKTAVVTGGGTGIGQAIALALAAEGCQVIVTGRRQEKLQESVSARAETPSILAHCMDVADRQSVDHFFHWVNENQLKVDILVNAAGTNVRDRSMQAIDPADWDRLLQIHATGSYNCMHAVLPQMRERRNGLIVNISSVAGKRASQLAGFAYSAAKSAQAALGTAVGLEVAEFGVRVTNVYPGEVDTAILDQRPTPVSHAHRAKILQPTDVADAVLMIACLPPRAHVPEIVIKPTWQPYT
ncbi:MAG: SDR family NAD(P)-dependent oxidoreductase [Pirellulales bacterium]|nr:SDR family NAD(P)-dependent oxidoreductase [Pirellulales bacterium]